MDKDKLVFVLTVLAENLESSPNVENVQKAMDFVIDEIAEQFADKVIEGITTTDEFNKDCEIVIEDDYWVFHYKGELKKKSKSKFEVLLAKKELQNELNV